MSPWRCVPSSPRLWSAGHSSPETYHVCVLVILSSSVIFPSWRRNSDTTILELSSYSFILFLSCLHTFGVYSLQALRQLPLNNWGISFPSFFWREHWPDVSHSKPPKSIKVRVCVCTVCVCVCVQYECVCRLTWMPWHFRWTAAVSCHDNADWNEHNAVFWARVTEGSGVRYSKACILEISAELSSVKSHISWRSHWWHGVPGVGLRCLNVSTIKYNRRFGDTIYLIGV